MSHKHTLTQNADAGEPLKRVLKNETLKHQIWNGPIPNIKKKGLPVIIRVNQISRHISKSDYHALPKRMRLSKLMSVYILFTQNAVHTKSKKKDRNTEEKKTSNGLCPRFKIYQWVLGLHRTLCSPVTEG